MNPSNTNKPIKKPAKFKLWVYLNTLMAAKTLDLSFKVPFSNQTEAEIVYNVLRVDKEPPRSLVVKTLSCDKNILHVCFKAPSAQQLRTGVNGFMDSLLLVCDTISNFGPPSKR